MEVEENEIDDSLYSRQLYVMGHEAMKSMSESKVLIIGLKGLGVEIAKNVILTGVKSVTLHDPDLASYSDLSSHFYLSESDVGKSRGRASINKLAELNSYVPVDLYEGIIDEKFLAQFKVVVLTQSNDDNAVLYGDICHAHGVRFILAESLGVFARVFCDFGDNFNIQDQTGENPKMLLICSISNEANAVISVSDDERHGLETGDVVTFTDIQGIEMLNGGTEYRIKVLGPYTFSIEVDTTHAGIYIRGGYIYEVKKPKSISFRSLREAMTNPGEFVMSDFGKIGRSEILHAGFKALHQFRKSHDGRLPYSGNAEDAVELAKITSSLCELDETSTGIIKKLSYTARGDISPMAAAIGGIVGQEVLKACSGKFTPIQQWFYFDACECLPNEPLPEKEYSPMNSRYDGQIAIFGHSMQERIRNLKYFLVGAGAIGCEMLKNWAMMGLGSGSNGMIHITDMDAIEKSNLSRQFLFRNTDISKLKSSTAASAISKMNPEVNVRSYAERVGESTEIVFHDTFMASLDGVCTALDNVEARLYMDNRAVQYQKPLLESGTLGTKGNTQIVVPFTTENYGASRDPPEKSVPICTLKNFPHQIEHTLQWARDYFEGTFKQTPEDTNKYISNTDFISSLEAQQNSRLETLKAIKESLVDNKPISFDECILWSRLIFQEMFHNSIAQLLYNFPVDQLTSSGVPFWSGHKRPPTPVVFDPEDKLHMEFIVSASNLRANIFGLRGESDEHYFRRVLKGISVPTFSPKVVKIATKDAELKEEKSNTEEEDFAGLLKTMPNPKTLAGFRLNPQEFEKDDDSNFHMDFITAASNLRARNYKIPEVNRHQSKLIAGKIIPAIATTTALVTGLIALELYKILQNKPLESYRNCFLNLAIPIFAFSEPIACSKNKIQGTEMEWSLWDKIDIHAPMTLQGFLDFFKKKYQLNVSMVSYGKSIIHAFFFPPAKIKPRLGMSIQELVESVIKTKLDSNLMYLPLEVCCMNEEDEDVDIPPVRFKLF